MQFVKVMIIKEILKQFIYLVVKHKIYNLFH